MLAESRDVGDLLVQCSQRCVHFCKRILDRFSVVSVPVTLRHTLGLASLVVLFASIACGTRVSNFEELVFLKDPVALPVHARFKVGPIEGHE